MRRRSRGRLSRADGRDTNDLSKLKFLDEGGIQGNLRDRELCRGFAYNVPSIACTASCNKMLLLPP